MANKKILINVEAQEKRVTIQEANVLQEFYVERTLQDKYLGNIYKGKVKSIVTSIQAAFIDIGFGKNAFLYVSDIIRHSYKYDQFLNTEEIQDLQISTSQSIDEVLKKDQEVLVQVVKEPMRTKGPRVTTRLALPGRYLVLLPGQNLLGISRKIKNPEVRKRLKELLKDLKISENMGIILRTVGLNCGKKEFIRDYRYLMNLWNKIRKKVRELPVTSLIHKEYDLVLWVIRDLLVEDIDELIVDSKQEYNRIKRFVSITAPRLKDRIKLYKEQTPLFEKYSIEQQIRSIYGRKVNLNCGGDIVIEPTEGLVAIDVNTGSFVRGKSVQETAFIVNKQAACEIIRQIRLRDLGGIIAIDFIDMKSKHNWGEIFSILREELSKDKAKSDLFIPPNNLGLVQITRQRTRKSVESVFYKDCPYCGGKGIVKSPITLAIQVVKDIKKYLQDRKLRQIEVSVYPEVASRLLSEGNRIIKELNKKFGTKITIKACSDFHIEQILIKSISK